MEGFELGEPVLICRWRLSNRKLPLENRHMRALVARTVNGMQVPVELMAWAKQHIEWTLEQGSADNPNGTLMLIVDDQGRAAMTVGPYVPLEDVSLSGLVRRADRAQVEAAKTGVAPETLWVVMGNELAWDPGEGCTPSGSASLVLHLAQTLGIDVRAWSGLSDAVATQAIDFDEAFLVSDEHGIVPASDADGANGRRLALGYQRLLGRR
ncbi:MAG: hypothetical protein J6D34_06465 [Atopobiaceae bacterium]|nr:hypothetical protein [Atopobiaceae bacterium]